ncbi:NAD(P)/FAD-dependent oxidoreductase [Halioxenophilus aromaticivorans]|uniref:NAD(P)/FAD-dependent oxidoreductase n=1 Tax=Halioxenophilus aromaticivorans TaxID=1306992 RepID=A0AAV3U9Y8_9ALTE
MKIVIVGGGAGGLELATKIGRKLGKSQQAEVVLIDRNQTHLWKPLLHKVATGALDAEVEGVSYRAHGHNNGYTFKLGELTGVDPERKCIQLKPAVNAEGEEFLPAREEAYDYLVLAIGSVANDFGIPGVSDHCVLLDRLAHANRLQQRLLEKFIGLNRELSKGAAERMLRVAIIGGGATGVELSAELYKAREELVKYGMKHVTPEHMQVTLIEAGPRLVPQLDNNISQRAEQELTRLGVTVKTNTQVKRADKGGFVTSDDGFIESDIMVWAAGVKAPDFLPQMGHFEFNRANQILVKPTLQTSRFDDVFAMGDCAGLQIEASDGQLRWVPARAQSAHQMADTVGHNLLRLIKSQPLVEFTYKDMGSLVSLGEYNAFGRLMGGLARGGLSVRGRIARWLYISLYRMHQSAIYGWPRTVLITINDRFNHWLRPRLKLR